MKNIPESHLYFFVVNSVLKEFLFLPISKTFYKLRKLAFVIYVAKFPIQFVICLLNLFIVYKSVYIHVYVCFVTR